MRRGATAFVSLMVIAAIFSILGTVPVGRATAAGANPEQVQLGLDVEMFDFFNVPYGEWWDYRSPIYGDSPIGADCFNQVSIDLGICDKPPTGPSGETAATYPYMNWWPWSGDRQSAFIYIPYRLRMTGADQAGSTLETPVVLPVFNAAELPGSTLNVNWKMAYLTTARINQLQGVCASLSQDGYLIESSVIVTMDLQESKRLFGVVATNPSEAQAWWNSNIDPNCAVRGPIEGQWNSFMVSQGGGSAAVGTYDVMNSFEWYYQAFMSQFSATVNLDTGMTTLTIDHVAWATEVLMARWFYWGSSSYAANAEIYPHVKSGWWPWELAWFEEFEFNTVIGANSQDFTLSSAMQYHIRAGATPGADGIFNTDTTPSDDDIPEWIWETYLSDYMYGGSVSVRHPVSEVDPYTGLTYLHTTPGTIYYGTQFKYDYVPGEWDLGPEDTVTIRAPTTPVKFINPLSPRTGDATTIATLEAPIKFARSTPALFSPSSATDSNGDGLLDTIILIGPIDWGAPGMPLFGYPLLEFESTTLPGRILSAELIGRSAWPGRHHISLTSHGDLQTFYAKVTNTGNDNVRVAARFTVTDAGGATVAVSFSETVVLALGETKVVSATLRVTVGKYSVVAVTNYDGDNNGSLDRVGTRDKAFSYTVVA